MSTLREFLIRTAEELAAAARSDDVRPSIHWPTSKQDEYDALPGVEYTRPSYDLEDSGLWVSRSKTLIVSATNGNRCNLFVRLRRSATLDEARAALGPQLGAQVQAERRIADALDVACKTTDPVAQEMAAWLRGQESPWLAPAASIACSMTSGCALDGAATSIEEALALREGR